MSNENQIDTPCVGICSTVYGDDFCRGCKRHFKEVIQWNQFEESKKQQVWERLGAQIVQIMGKYCKITCTERLISACHNFQVRYPSNASPLELVYYLMRSEVDKLPSLREYGIEVEPAYVDKSVKALFSLIDQELLELAYCVSA